MATIRAYTTIEQSRKLAEILPLESADMYYPNRIDIKYQGALPIEFKRGNPLLSQEIAAWSLVALLSVLPMITKGKESANLFIAKASDNEYYVVYATLTEEVDSSAIYDNPVDACVAMIEKLNKLKML